MTTFDLMADRSLGSLLADNLEARPDQDFVTFLGSDDKVTSHTYAQFWALMDQARAGFTELGGHSQAVVMSLLPNSPAMYLTWLAASCNGAVHLPIDPASGPRQVLQVMKLAQPVIVVVSPESEEVVRTAIVSFARECRVVVVHDLALQDGMAGLEGLPEVSAHAVLPCPVSNNDVAGLIQTSGTTGMPKLVEVTHANYIFAGESLVRSATFLPSDRHFIALPLFHSGAQYFSTMPALITGGSIGIVERFSASRYFDQATRLEGTCGVLLGPPMRMILGAAPAGSGTGYMRQIVYAQSLAPQEYATWAERFPNVRLLQMYGSTETVSLPIGRMPWNDFPQDSMGAPQIEREIALIDSEGRRSRTGPGEIIIRGVPGRTLMRGYFRNPEATAQVLRDGWYHSGDFARRDEAGIFYFEARAQHVMRRGGENVSLPEVELYMQDCPMVRDVATRSVPDPVLEERLVAYVIPGEGFSEDKFMAWCVDNIGRTGRPDDVVVMEDFPRTGVGKVRIGELPLPVDRSNA